MIIPYEHIGLVDKEREVLRLAQGRRVLHLGCTDWPITESKAKTNQLLHLKLVNVARQVVGLDYSREGLEALGRLTDAPLRFCDLTKDCSELLQSLGQFEVILCCDVLEHIANFEGALLNIKRFMAPDSLLIVTVPNSFAVSKVLYVLAGNREKQHPEHTCSFSLGNLQQLLARFGLVVIRADGFAYYSESPGPVRAKKLIHSLLNTFGRPGLADELMVRVKLAATSPD
jgi:SAM-dependent methyltransferase